MTVEQSTRLGPSNFGPAHSGRNIPGNERRVAVKLLLAVLAATTTIGIAAPVHGDAGDGSADDAGFLSALQQASISYPSPDRAIASAKAVCGCLSGGESGLELVHDVKISNPGFDMEIAADFAMISAKFYCPQQLSKA